jgi:hypothetical protein
MNRNPILASRQTLKQINQANRGFWNKQRELLPQRLADDALRQSAFEIMQAEQTRGYPAKHQMSLYQALDEGDQSDRRSLTRLSRKGGKARKTDALQKLIIQIAQRHPSITAPELLSKLKSQQGIEPIVEVDVLIINFKNHNGTYKDASITGLKDRLSRAKAILRSR